MPTSKMVQRAGPSDAALMAAIHAACFARAWDAVAMAQFAAAPGVLCLLGGPGDGIAPPAGLLIARHASDEAELLTIGVGPASRRAGLGRALLQHAAAELSSSGAKQLFLEVDEDNAAAVSLYRSLGAQQVGHRKAYYESGADAAIFRLALSDPPSDDGRTAR